LNVIAANTGLGLAESKKNTARPGFLIPQPGPLKPGKGFRKLEERQAIYFLLFVFMVAPGQPSARFLFGSGFTRVIHQGDLKIIRRRAISAPIIVRHEIIFTGGKFNIIKITDAEVRIP